jgi:hypothetical protein
MHHRLAELGSDERAEAEHASRLRRRVGAGTHTGRQSAHPPIAAPPRGPTERQATRPAPRGAVGRRPERQSDRRLGRRTSPDGRLREPRPGHRKAAAEKLITTAKSCPFREITRLGRTLTAWRTEFLARFDHPACPNGPTECLNLQVKNTKRAARGYRSFTNYRLRLLLNHGLIRDDQATARIQTRRTQVRCVEPGLSRL